MKTPFLLATIVLSGCSGGEKSTAPAPVASVTVSPATASLVVGSAQQFMATTTDASGSTLTGRVVAWSSSDATKASVSSGGMVTAAAVGSATITATSEGKSGTSTVTVQAAMGTINGKVTDASTAAALAGASVSTQPASGTATTDAQGNFTIANVSPGSYTVQVTAATYATTSTNASVTAGQTATANIALAPLLYADLTVTTTADAVNGDTSSTRALFITPGPDGISLREAIIAVDRSSGAHTITFAPALAGQTITLGVPVPNPPQSMRTLYVTRDSVTLVGLTTPDGQPNITIDGTLDANKGATIFVGASFFTMSGVRFVYVPASFSTIQIGGAHSRQGQWLSAPQRLTGIRIVGNAFRGDPASSGFAIVIGTSVVHQNPNATVSDVVVANNTFTHMFEAVNLQASNSNNIIEDVVIWGNTFTDAGAPPDGGGVEVAPHDGVNNTIRRARIVHNVFIGNNFGIDLNNNRDAGPPDATSTTTTGNVIDSTLIAWNVFIENQTSIFLMGGAGGPGLPAVNNTISNTQIVNNLISRSVQAEGTGHAGLFISANDISNGHEATGNRVVGVSVVNNTIEWHGSWSPAVLVSSMDGVSGLALVNTIIWPPNPSGPDVRGMSPDQVKSSIITQAGYAGINGNFSADPMFVNALQADFHLQSGSPAIGKGTSIGAPVDDLDCQTRKLPPSIGAYELNGPRNCPTQPPSSGLALRSLSRTHLQALKVRPAVPRF